MVLRGGDGTTPETLPVIIPELQNRSVTSVVNHAGRIDALTSSGKHLTFVRREDLSGVRTSMKPEFDHTFGAEARVEGHCLAVAIGLWHRAALVVDLEGDEVPPEDLEQDI